MSIHQPSEVSTFLADVVRIVYREHGDPAADGYGHPAPCATCELIQRAQELAATSSSDPDVVLFDGLRGAGAGDTVSNLVDHLEDQILASAPCLKVAPRAVLRAVIVTAQQRLDWGYGPIGGAHDGALQAEGDRTAGVSDTGAADAACDAELSAALDEAAVAVEIEAETVAELRPGVDTARAIRLIVQRLRDNGWTI
ncbi:MAG TPA: hypothetical protein VLA19_25095 [Herpetosiphonaceae bacterium]|nr:hypothetical protein [Herpetosiphonaceae bacterium]